MNYTDRFFEATTRIEKLIWIPSAIIDGSISDDLRDMIDELYDHNEHIIERLPRMKELLCSEDTPDGEHVAEVLAYVDGFFAQFIRPIPSSFYGDGAFTYSWGYCQIGWVFAETLDEIATLAEEFSAKVVLDARNRT